MKRRAIQVRVGDRLLQTVFVTSRVTDVGRAPDNDVILEDSGVSRHHARILEEDGRYFVVDRESAGGLEINGSPLMVGRASYRTGDRLRVGKFTLVLALVEREQRSSAEGRPAGDHGETQMLSEVADRKASTAITIPDDPLAADGSQPAHWAMAPGIQVYDDQGTLLFEKMLTVSRFKIGRAPDCHLVLDAVDVSRYHAEIRHTEAEDHDIADLGSGNGTFVNGSRVDEASLRIGDEVQVGTFKLVFLLFHGDQGDIVTAEATGDEPTPIRARDLARTALWDRRELESGNDD